MKPGHGVKPRPLDTRISHRSARFPHTGAVIAPGIARDLHYSGVVSHLRVGAKGLHQPLDPPPQSVVPLIPHVFPDRPQGLVQYRPEYPLPYRFEELSHGYFLIPVTPLPGS